MSGKPIPNFELSDSTDTPIWVQLRDRFVYLITSGYYAPGDQLPSVRKVAVEACISYNTVSKAYMSLEREGRIVTRHGSGAYVAEDPTGNLSEVELIAEEFVRTCLERGVTETEMPQLIAKTLRRIENEGR